MTVQDLIDELQKLPDKSETIIVSGSGEIESIGQAFGIYRAEIVAQSDTYDECPHCGETLR